MPKNISWSKLALKRPILGQNLDFWQENSTKYSRITSNFGAKIQICLKVKLCQNWVFGLLEECGLWRKRKPWPWWKGHFKTSFLIGEIGFLQVPIKAKACVQVVMETTKLGTEEQDRFTLRPSAKRTSLFPLGQMMWSTWVRTFSQVKSWVRKDMTSISVLECPMLQTMQPFFILSMCSRVTIPLLPEAVTTMSTVLITTSNFTT